MQTVFADLQRHYSGRTVLITGDTGFTGSWLAVWLSLLGAKIVGCARPPEGEDNLFSHIVAPTGLVHTDLDICDLATLNQVVEASEPDIVFHLAAQALVRRSYDDPVDTFASNVMGTVHILEACRKSQSIKAAVLITTDKVYRNVEWAWPYRESDPLGGTDPYSASKSASEFVIGSYRHSFFSDPIRPVGLAVARAGNIIGGGDWAKDRIVPDIVRALNNGSTLMLRNPLAVRPWQHVLAACHGYLMLGARLLAGDKGVASEWNFGPFGGDTHSVEALIDAFAAGWTRPRIIVQPSSLKEATALSIDSTRARTMLGWNPPWLFADSMAKTVTWYRNFSCARHNAYGLCVADIEAYVGS